MVKHYNIVVNGIGGKGGLMLIKHSMYVRIKFLLKIYEWGNTVMLIRV